MMIVGDNMLCPKCGVKLLNNSKYCPRCGLLFPSSDVAKYGEKVEQKLLSVYFPENKIGFSFHRISLGYLLFNFIYAFYKRMYRVGIISLLSVIYFYFIFLKAESWFISSLGFFALFLIFSFMLCACVYLFYVFKFNDYYIENIKFRIFKIVKNNPGADYNTLVSICEKNKKGNYLLAILSILLLIGVMFLM